MSEFDYHSLFLTASTIRLFYILISSKVTWSWLSLLFSRFGLNRFKCWAGENTTLPEFLYLIFKLFALTLMGEEGSEAFSASLFADGLRQTLPVSATCINVYLCGALFLFAAAVGESFWLIRKYL
jgi:hypothetical protein